MSKTLGRLELPNGGSLEVTAYAGPGRRPRLQLTLEQGEGGIVAHGNTDADGVAQLLGWLETWLLEAAPDKLGKKPRPAVHRDDASLASVDGPAPSRVEEEPLELEKRGDDDEEEAEALLWHVGQSLRCLRPRVVRDGAPDTLRELETLEHYYALASDRLREERKARATPASDRLEANDVSTSLEDFGKVGEERDEAFTAALERRRWLQRGGAILTVTIVRDAVRAALGTLEELRAACREDDVPPLTELAAIAHAARRFLEAKVQLDAILTLPPASGG